MSLSERGHRCEIVDIVVDYRLSVENLLPAGHDILTTPHFPIKGGVGVRAMQFGAIRFRCPLAGFYRDGFTLNQAMETICEDGWRPATCFEMAVFANHSSQTMPKTEQFVGLCKPYHHTMRWSLCDMSMDFNYIPVVVLRGKRFHMYPIDLTVGNWFRLYYGVLGVRKPISPS